MCAAQTRLRWSANALETPKEIGPCLGTPLVCSADGPGTVAFASGDLAQACAEVPDQNLGRLRADRESLRDHRDADEGRLEQQLGKGRQMRRLPASPAFARQQRARQDQPVVLGEALAGAASTITSPWRR
jgi:hypothetical protein